MTLTYGKDSIERWLIIKAAKWAIHQEVLESIQNQLSIFID